MSGLLEFINMINATKKELGIKNSKIKLEKLSPETNTTPIPQKPKEEFTPEEEISSGYDFHSEENDTSENSNTESNATAPESNPELMNIVETEFIKAFGITPSHKTDTELKYDNINGGTIIFSNTTEKCELYYCLKSNSEQLPETAYNKLLKISTTDSKISTLGFLEIAMTVNKLDDGNISVSIANKYPILLNKLTGLEQSSLLRRKVYNLISGIKTLEIKDLYANISLLEDIKKTLQIK